MGGGGRRNLMDACPWETLLLGVLRYTRLEKNGMWQRCMQGCSLFGSCYGHANCFGARRCMLHTRLVAIQLYMQPNNQTLSQQRESFSSIVISHASHHPHLIYL